MRPGISTRFPETVKDYVVPAGFGGGVLHSAPWSCCKVRGHAFLDRVGTGHHRDGPLRPVPHQPDRQQSCWSNSVQQYFRVAYRSRVRGLGAHLVGQVKRADSGRAIHRFAHRGDSRRTHSCQTGGREPSACFCSGNPAWSDPRSFAQIGVLENTRIVL